MLVNGGNKLNEPLVFILQKHFRVHFSSQGVMAKQSWGLVAPG